MSWHIHFVKLVWIVDSWGNFLCFRRVTAANNTNPDIGPAGGSVQAQFLQFAFDFENFRPGHDKELLKAFQRPADSPIGPVPKLPAQMWALLKGQGRAYSRHCEETYQDITNFIVQGVTTMAKLPTLWVKNINWKMNWESISKLFHSNSSIIHYWILNSL